MKTKSLKLPASAAQNPVAQPLGPATISGTTYTVDWLAQNPTVIPGIIRELVADRIGYFSDKIFDTPGYSVQGGAVIFEITKPNELFLPTDQSLAPRAPGAEAPRVGSTRGEPSIAFPESWSGSLEITNEAKRRNNPITIQKQMVQIANTFVNIFETRAIAVLEALVALSENARIKENKTNWATAAEAEASKLKGSESPLVDLAYVTQLFTEDNAGLTPKWLILNPVQVFQLTIAFPMVGQLDAMLNSFGLSIVSSAKVTAGTGYLVAEKGVGHILYEAPLTQETEYVARRKTTVTTMETVPVFVGDDPLAVIKLTKLAE